MGAHLSVLAMIGFTGNWGVPFWWVLSSLVLVGVASALHSYGHLSSSFYLLLLWGSAVELSFLFGYVLMILLGQAMVLTDREAVALEAVVKQLNKYFVDMVVEGSLYAYLYYCVKGALRVSRALQVQSFSTSLLRSLVTWVFHGLGTAAALAWAFFPWSYFFWGLFFLWLSFAVGLWLLRKMLTDIQLLRLCGSLGALLVVLQAFFFLYGLISGMWEVAVLYQRGWFSYFGIFLVGLVGFWGGIWALLLTFWLLISFYATLSQAEPAEGPLNSRRLEAWLSHFLAWLCRSGAWFGLAAFLLGVMQGGVG